MLKQSLQQKLLQKLSPQQIQLMKLLQLPTVALEQRIKEELEANPALDEGEDNNEEEEFENSEEAEADEITDKEESILDDDGFKEKRNDEVDVDDYYQDDDVPYYKLSANNSSPDDEKSEVPVITTVSFQDHLLNQLGLIELDSRQHLIAEHLIGTMDEDGYLRRDLESICNDLAFSQNIETNAHELELVLKIIQTFDPPGIGARNLQECLMLQLERKTELTRPVKFAKLIIRDFMEEFSKKHYEKISRHLGLLDEELKDAMHEILKLNPRPGGDISSDAKTIQHVIPDFIITNNDGQLELSLNSRNAPELKVSRDYTDMLKTYSKNKKEDRSNKEAAVFVRQKLESARWFIDAIKQRQMTLLNTMQTILNYQYEYFLEGDEKKLKPMILKDIAEVVGLDISTISRVANSKYVQTQFGTFPVKSFFSEALSTDTGEEVSSREVKKILSDAVSGENKKKPLPDDKLAKLLQSKGYNIARRTIAKYREQLNIPVARLRKEL